MTKSEMITVLFLQAVRFYYNSDEQWAEETLLQALTLAYTGFPFAQPQEPS